jgi:hypothetical protein
VASGAKLLADATPTFEAAVRKFTAGTQSSEELRALAATLARPRAALFNGLQPLYPRTPAEAAAAASRAIEHCYG